MSDPIVFLARDNIFYLQVEQNGVISDLGSVTKIELKLSDGTILSSATNPSWFDWTIGEGKIMLDLSEANLTARKTYNAKLIIYDTLNTDGIVWGQEGFNFSVQSI